METQGRKEVRDAVCITVLSALGTSLITWGTEAAREAWQDYKKKRKKRKNKAAGRQHTHGNHSTQ